MIGFLIFDLLIFDYEEQFDFWRPGRVSTSGARTRGGVFRSDGAAISLSRKPARTPKNQIALLERTERAEGLP